MPRPIERFDCVRLVGMRGQGPQGVCLNRRQPRLGDIACVVEIYTHPSLGYELECIGPDGDTDWLASFAAEDVAQEPLENRR